ncbi:MAG: sugar phosphate isomerase/epimerase family protein [Gemmatimonadales bacterium]
MAPRAAVPIERRAFLGAVAGAAAGLARPVAVPTGGGLERIGVQLYTVRDLLARDFAGTIARIAEIGYREVEFAGYHGHTPQQVRAVLARHRLAAPSAHVPFESLEAGWDAMLETAALVGHHYVVVAWVPAERRGSLDDWRRIADLFNQAGRACRGAGLQFAYHNQSYEFVPIEGRRPYDVLVEASDAGLVQLELDFFWIASGGADPLDYFARFPGRFPMVHLKDRSAAGDMVDVGRGAIEWRRLFARAAQAGIRHYFVEHDEPPAPLHSIRASYAYLKRLTF